MEQVTLVYLAAVLALGIAAQWLAWRFRLPSILLLLGFGFVAGEFVARPTEVIEESLLLSVVSLSVALILFEGGLTLRFKELREEAGLTVFCLCTLGALVTGILAAIFARFLFDLDWLVAALLGSILTVTGPTVVAPMLRQIKPVKRVGSIIKWEGIVIDPIGAVLALLVFQAALAGNLAEATTETFVALGKTILVGGGIGYAVARGVEQLLKHHLVPDFLHSVFLLAVTAVVFTISNLLQHESGLLTVTVLGIAMANQKSVSVKHVLEFKENLRILLISCLFIVLSGRISLEDLAGLGWRGFSFIAALVFVVRPACVFISTFPTTLALKERVFLSFLAPRGIVAAAVSSVFALQLAESAKGTALETQASMLVPITFAVIVGTVLIYGLGAAPLARKLGLAHRNPQGILFAGADAWVQEVAKTLQDAEQEVLLIDTNEWNVSRARMNGLPTLKANILSEYVRDELDLSGIGRLLAVTANNEVNSLAAQEFAPLLGGESVYQLASKAQGEKAREAGPSHLNGRVLFAENLTHSRLNGCFESGMVCKCTELTEKFTIDDFRCQHGESALLLFVIMPDNKLSVIDAKQEFKFGPGQKVVALIEKVD